jgi:predicted nuclease with TOPRIM domain
MADKLSVPDETIVCPLCLGEGKLKRTEVLDRLGVKDLARVAQLSAEEAFRLLQRKHNGDEQNAWVRFDAELAKRVAEVKQRHTDELHTLAGRIRELESAAKLSEQHNVLNVQRVRAELEGRLRSEQSQKEDLNRRVEGYFTEINQLRERNRQLEAEMAKVARVGKLEEIDFAEEARSWPGIHISEKLSRNGDYILAYRDPSGAALEPRMLVDNKDKAAVAEGDVEKLVRDAKERSTPVAILLAREESQLRQVDRETRWTPKDGVWVLRTTRQWLPRDLDVLRPLFERMRIEGPDFLSKNAVLAEEVRRTFADIDKIEKELGKASKAIQSASGLVGKYRERLRELCDNAATRTFRGLLTLSNRRGPPKSLPG